MRTKVRYKPANTENEFNGNYLHLLYRYESPHFVFEEAENYVNLLRSLVHFQVSIFTL